MSFAQRFDVDGQQIRLTPYQVRVFRGVALGRRLAQTEKVQRTLVALLERGVVGVDGRLTRAGEQIATELAERDQLAAAQPHDHAWAVPGCARCDLASDG